MNYLINLDKDGTKIMNNGYDRYRWLEIRNQLIRNDSCFYQFVFELKSFKDKRDISKENKYVVSLTILFNRFDKEQYNDFNLLKRSSPINSCSHKVGSDVKNNLFKLLSNLNNEKIIIIFEKSKTYKLLPENSELREFMNNKVNYLYNVATNVNEAMEELDDFIYEIDNEITNYKLFKLSRYYKE